ncbi:MAG: hypothetical protein ACLUGJ_00270 [Blautia wexlerae]
MSDEFTAGGCNPSDCLPAVVDAVQPADAILLKTTRQSPLPWKTIQR